MKKPRPQLWMDPETGDVWDAAERRRFLFWWAVVTAPIKGLAHLLLWSTESPARLGALAAVFTAVVILIGT
ncbi:hypothetical protein [Embleya sp. NPDC005575]|uniref:hypothetical protein n=1 Tax=Embleya sp. NPDC005575 TaxID=3156892 RepID=UPI0033A66C87